MSCFPQIGAGSIAQFPLSRSQKWRVITNTLEDGEQIILPDATAGQVEWRLSYQDLTYAEAAQLSSLFTDSRGSFGAFTFIDPLANLLGWSENFTQPNWQAGLLQVMSGIGDPLGTLRAASISNPNPATQALQQTLEVPGAYVACFSLYVRSDTDGTVTLQRDNTPITVGVSSSWKRQFLSSAGIPGATQSTFSIVLAAGQTVEVWGLQVEAQPWSSAYKQTAAPRGIYEETYFENDELKMTSTSVGLSSCQIALISRVE